METFIVIRILQVKNLQSEVKEQVFDFSAFDMFVFIEKSQAIIINILSSVKNETQFFEIL